MPQSTSKATGFAFRGVGKGESHELTLDGCMKSWKRAEMLNHKEAVNLRMRHDYINRHAHMLEEKQKRTVEKIEGSFRTMRAYHSLMTGDFKADNFDTLVWGYKTPDAKTEPERFQRFVYETRIYHSGFTVQALRRQVNRRLEEMQHDRVRELARTRRMERLKRGCVVDLFDRNKSFTKILDDHRDTRGNMRIRVRKLSPIIAKKQTFGADSSIDDDDDIENQSDDDEDDRQ